MTGLSVAAVAIVGGWVFYMRSIDQPAFTIVQKDGDIEIRDYGALAVAEVIRSGDRESAVRAGFRPLARYIFAKDRPGEAIAMTAPVTQQKEADTETTWTVRFIMPDGKDENSLPQPATEDVRLLTLPPARRAVVRFSGRADDQLIETNDRRLLSWLDAQGHTAIGSAVYAYYDDPLTPGMFRRNEVSYEIRR